LQHVPCGIKHTAVLRIRGTKKGLAVATDGNARYCFLDPFRGGAIAVAEATRNVACAGAEPLAITNCLNFGDPGSESVYRQFARSVQGMAEACRALGTPVVGGNVSFYNETPAGPIKPTPVVGAVGLLDDVEKNLKMGLQQGSLVYLLGETREEIGGSLYQFLQQGCVEGLPPGLDLRAEKQLQRLLIQANCRGLLLSAHDVSEGGLFLAIVEMAVAGGRGASLHLPGLLAPYLELFSESQSRAVVTLAAEKSRAFETLAADLCVPCFRIGRVIDEGMVKFLGSRGELLVEFPLQEVKEIWQTSLGKALKL